MRWHQAAVGIVASITLLVGAGGCSDTRPSSTQVAQQEASPPPPPEAPDEKSDCAPGAPPNSAANALDFLKVHCDRNKAEKALGKLALLGAVIALVPEGEGALAEASGVAARGAAVEEGALTGEALAETRAELGRTIARVKEGGPFPYAEDGSVFRNAEGRLPSGNYREYTVDTPSAEDRGARRLVINSDDGKMYYTSDHYGTFHEVVIG